MSHQIKPVIVFDLDHTLITPILRYVSGVPTANLQKFASIGQHYPETAAPHMRVLNTRLTWLPGTPRGDFDIYVRPWTRELLAAARARYRIGIWTFSDSEYATPIVEKVLGLGPADLEFLYTRDRPPPGYVKGTGKPLQHIIDQHGGPAFIVEDTPENCHRNPEFCMIVSRFDCEACPGNYVCLDGQNCETTKHVLRSFGAKAPQLAQL